MSDEVRFLPCLTCLNFNFSYSFTKKASKILIHWKTGRATKDEKGTKK